MKNILVSLSVLFIIPSILFAETSYFLVCKEGQIIDQTFEHITINIKKGDWFEIAEGQHGNARNKNMSYYNKETWKNNNYRNADLNEPIQATCWKNSGEPKCPLFIWYGRTAVGFVNLELGCWFRSEQPIPTKGLFKKYLDEELVNVMCSPHTTNFSVAGNIYTDLTMKYAEEHLELVEKDLLEKKARTERIMQQRKAEEERNLAQRQEDERFQQEVMAILKAQLRKYGAEALVPINMLEVNPYEYEGHTIAVVVSFKKMLSKNTASFFSGYENFQSVTGVPDEIVVTGIPKGTHFKAGVFAPRMTLVLKGKGTITGTNAFGAAINAPHFQWIAIMSGQEQSAFDEQLDVSRKNVLRNLEVEKQRKSGQ